VARIVAIDKIHMPFKGAKNGGHVDREKYESCDHPIKKRGNPRWAARHEGYRQA
jgi:hypothetical protein